MGNFNTFYYTDAFISDRRTLSLLSILSDSVYLFYLSPDYFLKPLEERWQLEKEQPFFTKAQVECSLITREYHNRHVGFIKENSELVNTQVILPILVKTTPPDWESLEQYEQQLFDNYSGLKIGYWGMKIGLVPDDDKVYVDTPFFSLYRWQSFSSALHFAIRENITPISDNPVLSDIARNTVTKLCGLNIEYAPPDLAKVLGLKVLSSLLPDFGELRPEQILEIRDDMRDELMAFRHEMCQIATMSEVEEDKLDEYIKFKVKPRVEDLKLRIASSKKALYRKIGTQILATGAGTTVLTQFLNLPPYTQIAFGIGLVVKMLIDYFGYRDSKKEALSESGNRGLALLLDLENRYSR